ncbi:MAG: PAS domain S-box protein [Acidobacteria bacterium]|nr:PAS domain S-box protein [Acidobacteriota bacterium]
MVTLDEAGTITFCSQGGEEMLGAAAAEVVGQSLGSFCAGGQPESRRFLERLLQEDRIRDYLTELITPAGKRIPVALSGRAIRGEAGELLGAVCVAHDLSEIRRLEDELAAKNRFMANILKDSADAIMTLDPDNFITSWNRGAEAIFGFSAAEAVGKHINLIIPPELQAAREIERITDTVRAYGVLRSYQTERITKDGRRIQVIFTRTSIRDDAGRIIGSSAVLKDVTNVLNLERQLAYAEHLASLGELSAGLAHEIKNPLAGIKGVIDVIRDSLAHSDVHREILGDVLREVDRIDRTVQDLLTYAKPKPPSHGDVDLIAAAQRMIAMSRQSSRNGAVSIELDSSVDIPRFTGDQTQLEQVLLNLLLNAQNAVHSRGRIVVRLRYDRTSGDVRIVVEDDGCGIPEEIRRKIFQPFFTTRTDGTGLGLATCLKNVQYHGGTIDVQSEVGKGTRFIVTLPMFCRL